MIDRLAVDAQRTRTALPVIATLHGVRQLQTVAHDVEQNHIGGHAERVRLSVDVQLNAMLALAWLARIGHRLRLAVPRGGWCAVPVDLQ